MKNFSLLLLLLISLVKFPYVATHLECGKSAFYFTNPKEVLSSQTTIGIHGEKFKNGDYYTCASCGKICAGDISWSKRKNE